MATASTLTKFTQGEKFRKDVKTYLALNDEVTVTKLAKKIGKSRPVVSQAINHPTMHPTVKVLIAKALKITPPQV
jgi:hypothetical protein